LSGDPKEEEDLVQKKKVEDKDGIRINYIDLTHQSSIHPSAYHVYDGCKDMKDCVRQQS
jgi:hypothetical protein